ncbi:MAG: AAA family ATPase [Oscillospiraceae bacterium]|nr:AAA family ATPase [Oscillospiraceae bacterium]
MKIKKMTARFGKLQDQTLELHDGLNIIHAPNESGKSTWCGFISAMLYGIDSAQREKGGVKPDKVRFAPWNGNSMAGEMEIEHEGKEITLSRSTRLASAPMREFSAVYTGTAEKVADLSGTDAGQILTGLPKSVFESSVFVRQSGLGVQNSAELEKRIGAIVTTGEEGESYTDADAQLRAWLRKRKHNKSGAIPALDTDIAALEKTRSDAVHISTERDEAAKHLARLTAEDAQLKKDEAILSALSVKAQGDILRREADKASQLLSESEKEYESVKTKIAAEENRLRAEESSKRDTRRARIDDLERALNEEREQEIALRVALENGIFGMKTPEKVSVETEDAEKECREIRAKCEKSKKPLLAIILGIAGIILLALGAVALPCAAVGLALIVAAVIVFVIHRGKMAKLMQLSKQREDILRRYRIESEEEFYSLACAHSDAWQKWEKSKQSIDTLRETLQRERTVPEEPMREIKVSDSLTAALKQAEEKLIALRTQKRIAEEQLAALAPCEIEGEYSPARHSEVKARLASLAIEISEARQRADILEGRAQTMGDPMVLGTQLLEAKERLDKLTFQYDALSLAIETLKDANDEMQSRFSPRLGALASEYMARLTANRYERLTFDRELSAQARLSGDTESHDLAFLSAGGRDQLYLALRLAICTLALPEGSSCPLILDDALVNFDDDRMRLALDLLSEISKERQVILFTCHEREKLYLDSIS